MTPRAKIKALHVGMSLDEVLRFIAQNAFSRYPVYQDGLDSVIGIIHVKDLMSSLQRGGMIGSWTRAVRRPYFVSELALLGEILRDMKRWGSHMAVVRNETGVVTGVLTLEDLIEEIVGDIRDEHDDPSEAGLEGPIGGPKVIKGDMTIVDFNERFSGMLPISESYSTLNGYILRKCGGALPVVGTLIFDEDFTFKIVEVGEHGVPSFEVLDVRSPNESAS
jgi:putative hemolysin